MEENQDAAEQPKKVFKVSVEYVDRGSRHQPNLVTGIEEYAVLNMTEKSYVLRRVGQASGRRALPKESIDFVQTGGSPISTSAHVWVFGSTGLATDRCKAAIFTWYKGRLETVKKAIDFLKQES